MRKAIVVGLGKSGIEAAGLLAARGDIVFITEARGASEVKMVLEALIRENIVEPQNVECGGHTAKFIKGADLMVVSPGVDNDSVAVKLAEKGYQRVDRDFNLAKNARQLLKMMQDGLSDWPLQN